MCFLGQFGLREGVVSYGFAARAASGEGGISMTLKMTDREVNGVSVVELDGRIVLGEESTSFREKLKSLIAEGKKKIVLNMADIKYIDSSGLGTMVAAHLSAKNRGASVRLCHLGQKFHEILQMTKLLTVFDVYDTEAAAISSFQISLVASN
jgi:anti-sigma B factor antagonist